jgi:putative ABC transport system permease protein
MSERWVGLRRVMRIATRRSAERDVDSEIDFHLASRTRELVGLGHDLRAARAIAEGEFGDVAETRFMLTEVVRRRQERVQRADWWESLGQDVMFASRALRRTPGMTAMIVSLLVLGVGANAATFAVADELFLRPPTGVAGPSSLSRLYLRTNHTLDGSEGVQPTVEYAAYAAIASAVAQRASLAAYMPPDSEDVTVPGMTQTLFVAYATTNYFPLLGARVALGRAFSADENRLGAGSPVAVISWRTWQNVFGGDSTVLGRRLGVAGEQYTVIGVTAEGFSGPDLDRTDLWLPIATYPGGTIVGTPWYQFWYADAPVRVLARVAPTATLPTIAAVATAAYRNGQQQQYGGNRDTAGTVLTGPLLEARGPTMSAAEGAIASRLVGVTVVVLLVACANVANLLLLRGLRRRRDVAIQLALGISPRRLLRQSLLESMLLAAVASLPVIMLAAWGGAVLRAMVLPSVHWSGGVLNWRVIGASIAIALVTAVIAGVAPALRARRTDLATAFGTSVRGGSARSSTLRACLLGTQAALSVVLLAGAGFFVYSLRAARRIELGYDADRIVYGTVLFRNPTDRSLRPADAEHAAEFTVRLRGVSSRLRNDQRIESVALADVPPMGQVFTVPVFLSDGRIASVTDGRNDPALIFIVEPRFFVTTGTTVLRGRAFTEADGVGSSPVAVVSQTTARTYWPGRDPIGQCVIVGSPDRACATVIGVTRDVHALKILEPPQMGIFLPMAQTADRPPMWWVVARAPVGATDRTADVLRRELTRAFPNGEPYVTSVARDHEPELRTWIQGATLFSVFGALALVVATIAVYCVLAYAVNQRVHELGVRTALGAPRAQLVQLVLAQGMRSLVIGVACGIVLTLLLGRLVSSMLYGIAPTNPWMLAASGIVLLLSGGLGSAVPAWRATRVDPVVALRAE